MGELEFCCLLVRVCGHFQKLGMLRRRRRRLVWLLPLGCRSLGCHKEAFSLQKTKTRERERESERGGEVMYAGAA